MTSRWIPADEWVAAREALLDPSWTPTEQTDTLDDLHRRGHLLAAPAAFRAGAQRGRDASFSRGRDRPVIRTQRTFRAPGFSHPRADQQEQTGGPSEVDGREGGGSTLDSDARNGLIVPPETGWPS